MKQKKVISVEETNDHKVFAAWKEIIEVLQPLDADARRRVILAAQIILGIDQ